MKLESISHLLALAARLEGEGQLNNAKLLYAAADSILTRAAYQLEMPVDRASLVAESDRAIAALSGEDFELGFTEALNNARQALAEGRLPHIGETPDPYVCRTCGHLSVEAREICPVCGAHPVTLKRFRPAFWLEAFDPFQSLTYLGSIPEQVAVLLDALPDSRVEQIPEQGGWSLREAVTHLRDAQGVLDFRVDLILDHENPLLESQAVFEWASDAAAQPETLGKIFETYRRSRAKTLARLDGIPLVDWWRCGQHEEFGELRLFQQVSYFACHELVHLPQLESLATE